MLSRTLKEPFESSTSEPVLVDDFNQDGAQSVAQAIALIQNLSLADQKELAFLLLQQLPLTSQEFELLKKVLADSTVITTADPLGQNSKTASGWKQEKRVLKERASGAIDIYIEYWFNCELWSAKEQQWKHKSCYICQHREGKAPSPAATRKIEQLNRQIANKRPYRETLEHFNKQHKLEQWEAI